MKRYLLSMALLLILAACSKTETPPTSTNSSSANSGGGNTGGGSGTTSNNVGNTTDYKGYLVKTVGIDRIRMAVDANGLLTIAELVGGGNHIVLKKGTENKLTFSNDFIPAYVEQRTETYPFAKYQVAEKIDNSRVLDTSGVVLRLTGFDKAKTGFNQLNLVLCQEAAITTTYNVYFLELKQTLDRDKYNNAYFKSLFTTSVNVTTLDLAKPDNKYITRDIVSVGLSVNVLDDGRTEAVDAYNVGDNSLAKIRLTENGAKNVGGLLKTELVNAEKGQLGYKPYVINSKTFYSVTFSNLIASSPSAIVEPKDTTNNVFLRVTGFDPKICGYNQLRIFLIQNPYFKNGSAIIFTAINRDEKYTLDQIKSRVNVSNRYCIALNTM